MASSSGLGPYCTAVGLSAEMLKGNGRFPSVTRIANGLVIELLQFARVHKIRDSVVSTWVEALGMNHERIAYAMSQLFERRKELRRKRRTAELAILECARFSPDDWPAPAESVPINSTPTTPTNGVLISPTNPPPVRNLELEKQNNTLHHGISKKEKVLQKLTTILDRQQHLDAMKKRKGHYGVRNVNKRDTLVK